jgi:predicted nucleotidyltransferase
VVAKSPKRERPSLEEVLRVLRARLPELREKYAVKSLAVFGSYVRGEQGKRSDLDVLVEFDEEPRPRITLIEYVGLQNELSDLVGVKVDLVERKGLKPRIGMRVLREALPV